MILEQTSANRIRQAVIIVADMPQSCCDDPAAKLVWYRSQILRTARRLTDDNAPLCGGGLPSNCSRAACADCKYYDDVNYPGGACGWLKAANGRTLCVQTYRDALAGRRPLPDECPLRL